MSQIASFTYLKESDVPFLGFWSKPKARLFRRPVSRFDEFLRQHTLRKSIFEAADGVYVAFAFAWFEMKGWWSASEEDPVIETVRRHLEGSHWLVEFRHQQKILPLRETFSQREWPSLLLKVGVNEADFERDAFEVALHFVLERFAELKVGEALLVSIG